MLIQNAANPLECAAGIICTKEDVRFIHANVVSIDAVVGRLVREQIVFDRDNDIEIDVVTRRPLQYEHVLHSLGHTERRRAVEGGEFEMRAMRRVSWPMIEARHGWGR